MEEDLYHIRHSLAHLLATAALEHDPRARLSVGPVTDNGFYYDIDFSEGKTPNPDDLKTFEKRMRTLVNKKLSFVRQEVSVAEAREHFAGNPYKLTILDDLEAAGATVSLYTTGDFTDLCEGRHVENTGEIDAKSFTLTHLAGAYFRGDESKPMLTRVYGLAFATGEELKAYLAQQEEAKKRDHRKLGKELGLFVFSELVGPGLPLWTPKGTIIRELLNDYVWELRKSYGYQKVTIPHITKKDLYETSGHWSKFSDELFKVKTREDHLYALKPMNCPHHTQIFAAEQRSYRNMPERYCETTMVYRDEQSGELSGLSRVLSITQDDAHVFCRETQIEQEVYAVWDIIDRFYKTFGFDLTVRFSRHDPAQKEKYLGDSAIWERSENTLRTLIEKRGATPLDGLGEAAMYGPKIDFIAKDSLGRTLQVATIQLDFNQPKSFGLTCVNEKGEKEPIVIIHCAIMGSLERFISILIEHYAGAFPVWLAPVQVVVLPIGESHRAYAAEVTQMLRAKNIRVVLDESDESLGKRVRIAKVQKTPYLFVIGDKEVEAQSVAIEHRSEGSLGTQTLEHSLEILEAAIAAKR